ncbi:MAG: YoaK family protein [Candidatus Acidiferrales bacterium]
MPKADVFERHRPKIIVALLLTFASGLVDIIGYLGVFHFFVAHLTGTTVHLGENLIERNRTGVLSAGAIVAAFLLGSVFGRAVIEVGSRARIRKTATITLAIEAAMLLALVETTIRSASASSSIANQPYWALAALAGAMGIQTATLTGIGPLTVHTTFVTGMVNKLAQLISHTVFTAYDLARKRPVSAAVLRQWHEDIKKAAFLSMIWVFYVSGAAFGTWSYTEWGLRSLFVAIGLLLIGIATDQIVPLSIEEEAEQSER